jgi:hypothetical protein
MDNLRLSMAAGLSDTKVLRYRCNAVSLSRASDNARTILEAVQAKQEQTRKIPRPSVAAAPSTKTRLPSTVAASNPQRSAPLSSNTEVAESLMDIESMKRDARIMMAAFSKSGGHASTAIPAMPDIDAAIDAAARAAVAHAPVTPSRRIATG